MGVELATHGMVVQTATSTRDVRVMSAAGVLGDLTSSSKRRAAKRPSRIAHVASVTTSTNQSHDGSVVFRVIGEL